MIVWSGKGFLVAAVFVVVMFLSISVLPNELNDYSFVISSFITAIFSWIYGVKWNSNRILIDEKTGEKFTLKNTHTFFWIPMQYWSIIATIFGLIILFQNSVISAIVFSIIFLSLLIFQIVKNNPSEIGSVINSKKNIEKQKQLEEEERKRELEEKLERERIRKEKEDPRRFMPK